MLRTIFVSACLTGEKCSYDGGARFNKRVCDLQKNAKIISLCPEMLAGLGCPRDKHELKDTSGEDVLDGKGIVISFDKEDHSKEFIDGANKTLQIIQENNIKIAITKARSPSCGKGEIYSGNFEKKLRAGNGVTVALLLRNGIKIFTEDEIDLAEKMITV